ncbi:MAG: hypothetical protein IT538_01050 [Variibacter sp.]|nr:hypothetical protein [Variibacter sp.]
MIRFLLRFVGFAVLAAAFVALIYDGTRSIAANQVTYTPLGPLWTQVHAASLQWLQSTAEHYGPAWLWSAAAAPLLSVPAFAVLTVIGALLMLVGRKKKPVIGYAR